MVAKAVEGSNNVTAIAFPKYTDVDMSFWILSSAVKVK